MNFLSRRLKERNFNRLFDNRKSHLDSRIKLDYIKNGIATVHCCISSYNYVISAYSAKAKNQETLNFDFVEYLKSATKVIPYEYPIVLNIIGDCLTDDEKKLSLMLFVMILLMNLERLKRITTGNINYFF